MTNKEENTKRKITSEDLKDTLNRVRLALAISGLMGGSIVGTSYKENKKDDLPEEAEDEISEINRI